ncbi:MAG: gliding motility-associated C-terminal domain-containing protein [Flavobacterium sp.]|nr:gliding motility-associated C-terminal domain-containing protein [Pedobacter sp.]
MILGLSLISINFQFGYSQTCSGSLGDPVVNITFGSGGVNAVPLPTGSTTYSYSGDVCPNDGFYNISSRSISCFGDTWHTVNSDHTPNDKEGRMMVINASFQAGDFYTQKVSGLCGGTTYEFSSWILNILKSSSCFSQGIQPDITFTIESTSGAVISSYNTGNIAAGTEPNWKQYGFFFTAPNGVTELVIRMTNNAVGGCGNDLALDDITFRACGPAITATNTTNLASNKLCEGEPGTINLSAEISLGYNDPAFQWQMNNNDGQGWNDIPGANQPAYILNLVSANKEGYQFRLAVAEKLNLNSASCRILSSVLNVEISKDPVADAGLDITIIEGGSTTISGKAEGSNLRFIWTPSSYLSNTTILNPVVNPPESTTYLLTVISDDGCNLTSSDEVFIKVLKNPVIPNTFTPNGDLKNDLWNIIALDSYADATIKVYNRYGQIIFESIGYAEPWDGSFRGKPLPVGVYFYIIDLKRGSPVLKGSVSVLR